MAVHFTKVIDEKDKNRKDIRTAGDKVLFSPERWGVEGGDQQVGRREEGGK